MCTEGSKAKTTESDLPRAFKIKILKYQQKEEFFREGRKLKKSYEGENIITFLDISAETLIKRRQLNLPERP